MRYVPHLEHRLQIRRIPRELPERVYRNAEERFYDLMTDHEVAIMHVRYRRKLREIMVAYDRHADRVELVTIHPLQPGQKRARVESGRWERL